MKRIDGKWHAESYKELAEVFGVSDDRPAAWKRLGMPGSPRTWPLREIAKWLRSQGPWRPRGGEDPLLSPDEGESPALERYRDEQAQIAKLKRLEMEGQLIPRDTVHRWLVTLAGLIRKLGERLQRTFGEDARQMLDETLDNVRRESDRLCGANDTDRQPGDTR